MTTKKKPTKKTAAKKAPPKPLARREVERMILDNTETIGIHFAAKFSALWAEMNGKVSGIDLEKRLKTFGDAVAMLNGEVDELAANFVREFGYVTDSDLKANPTSAHANHTSPLYTVQVQLANGSCLTYRVVGVSERVVFQKIKLMFPGVNVISAVNAGMVIL